jgi:electron-transferring-flavoprotein dehydrogenase
VPRRLDAGLLLEEKVMEREIMVYDVVVVGGGPAGLTTAIRLMQLATETSQELSVCVLEKAGEIGGHILSGAVLESRALEELFPDWKEKGAPLNTEVTGDEVYLFTGPEKSVRIPNAFVPRPMHNGGNYVASLGNLCRWLGQQAEELGVEIFPGFPAAELRFDENGRVQGVATGDMGVNRNGEPKDGFEPGMELHGKYTIVAEGSRGHLGKQLIERFNLAEQATAQHYAIGLKELWDVDADRHRSGLVMHGAGWPLGRNASGGSFLYHLENNQVVVGLIVDLNYSNPYLSPFEEFQRFKRHPLVRQYLEGGRRVCYGARSITKGGLNSLPKMTFPGGLLVGCDAGTLNFAKIKGTHTAMKSGMLAAETVFTELSGAGEGGKDLKEFDQAFKESWLFKELHGSRNFGPALHKLGTSLGGFFNLVDQNILRGKLPITLKDKKEDHTELKPAAQCTEIDYPKPDGVISFDRLSSVYLSNTVHEEDQPVHLQLKDKDIPIKVNLETYAAPEQRYCPAGVYEIISEGDGAPHLQINAANCLHCKTCDIKDPTQNINWVTPEGGGGPNYPNM